jgi:hypothetical protein
MALNDEIVEKLETAHFGQSRETIVSYNLILFQQRYYYYITNGVDTQHVAEMEDKWLYNVMKLLPSHLKMDHQPTLGALSIEMREDYHMSVKKAIGKLICFVMRSGFCFERSASGYKPQRSRRFK